MKNKIINSLFVLLFVTTVVAQLPPPPASVSDVSAGTDKYKYVTPYTLANSGVVNGAVVSNQVIAATITSFYTNATPQYVSGYARLGVSGIGILQCAVTNSGNTLLFHYQAEQFSGAATSNTIAFGVPPGGWWKFIGTGGTTATDGSQALFYSSTNTGSGGGGSGDVTQEGLAAGSYPISEQSLTGFLRFSSTNTAFADGSSSNAITVVSNGTYASFVVPSQVSLGVNIGGTYYRKAYGVYTNGSIGAVFYDSVIINEDTGSINFTNAAHSVLEVDILAFVAVNGVVPWFDVTDEVLDSAAASFSPSPIFPDSVVSAQSPESLVWHGQFVGSANLSGYQQIGTNTSTEIDNLGLNPIGNGLKISVKNNSDLDKVALAIINPFPKLTEIYIENQTNGTRLGFWVQGVNWYGDGFVGASGLYRVIDAYSAEPHTDLFTVNRTNSNTTVRNNLIVTNATQGVDILIRCGTGTPESVVTGSIGDVFIRTDGSTSTTLYIKTSGSATTTGWTAK